MEEDNNFWPGAELAHELREDDWDHASYFIKEYSNSADVGDGAAAKSGGKFYVAVGGLGEEMGGLDSILAFGGPLLFFPKAPEHEDG